MNLEPLKGSEGSEFVRKSIVERECCSGVRYCIFPSVKCCVCKRGVSGSMCHPQLICFEINKLLAVYLQDPPLIQGKASKKYTCIKKKIKLHQKKKLNQTNINPEAGQEGRKEGTWKEGIKKKIKEAGNEGKKEGIKEGSKKGRKEGMKEGRKEGRKQERKEGRKEAGNEGSGEWRKAPRKSGRKEERCFISKQ